MAKELALDRPAAYRAGQTLLQAGILVSQEGHLALEKVRAHWNTNVLQTGRRGPRQLLMPGISVARVRRWPLSANNAPVAGPQLKRCLEATVFRRAKDSSKERLKTYKEKHLPECDDVSRHANGPSNNPKRQHLAGAAQPIPGKYDGISKN
jgi:hypothetical protein